MAIPADYRGLMNSLVSATRQKKLVWEKAKDKDSYFVSFEKSSISIEKSRRNYRRQLSGSTVLRQFLTLTLFNADGERIDAFGASDAEEDYPVLLRLWESISRRVLGIDDAIRGIQDELSKLSDDDDESIDGDTSSGES